MGKSFVLRNEHGDPVGYLMQGMHAVRCRVRAMETEEIIVFLQDGSHESRRIEHPGEELEWREEKSTVVGAVTLENGRISAVTGEDARWKWSQMEQMKRAREANAEEQTRAISAEQEKARRKEEAKSCEKAEEKAEEKTEEKAAAGEKNTCLWPQRRWPPPPCWRTAVYCHGVWEEEKV